MLAVWGYSLGTNALPQSRVRFASVGVALDAFPFNRLTITLDPLRMGVPVIVLPGRLAQQRAGASVLSADGLQRCIASTPEHYLQLALGLRSTLADLAHAAATRFARRFALPH